MMQLRVSTPDRIVLEDVAARIIAEAENGAFCLLPRHRDFATALLPGLFEYTTEDGGQRFLAVDEGLLVKSGIDVSVSTRHAVVSQDLQSLMRVVEEEFTELDDRERAARAAVARLEADFARRFLTLREHEHG
ncbi:MAG: F0F1 ATP synthase subunit epsilon [Planctomycetaceae bacterium]